LIKELNIPLVEAHSTQRCARNLLSVYDCLIEKDCDLELTLSRPSSLQQQKYKLRRRSQSADATKGCNCDKLL